MNFNSYNHLQIFLSDFASCMLCKESVSSCPHFEGTHCLFENTEFPAFDTQVEIVNADIHSGGA